MRGWTILSPGERAVAGTALTEREVDFLWTAQKATPAKVIQSAVYWGLGRVARIYATRLASAYFYEKGHTTWGVRRVGEKKKYVKKNLVYKHKHSGPCKTLHARGMCKPCYQRSLRQRSIRRKVAA